MTRTTALIACLLVYGCGQSDPDDKPMTNDQIVSEVAKCKAGGLKAEALAHLLDGDARTVRIQCVVP